MIALVISACFINDPSVCKTFQTPLAEEHDLRKCATNMIPFLPQWAEDHPGWQIAKWSCASSLVADL